MKISEAMKVNTNENSLTAPFKLTRMLSNSGPMNKTISMEGGELKISADHNQFEGDLDVIECNGLLHLKHLMETSGGDVAFIPGCPQHDGELIQSIEVAWGNQKDNPYDRNSISREDGLVQFIADETALLVFEVPGHVDEPPEVLWDFFSEIDPRLTSIGYMVVYSPASYIRDSSNDLMLTGMQGYRIYCLVKNGADILRYGRTFVKRCWMQGYGRIELTESGEYLDQQIVNVAAFHPEQMMCESPPIFGDGLTQEKSGMQLHAGGLLDTEMLKDLDGIEDNLYEDLVREARLSAEEVYAQDRRQWLEMKSSEIEKFTGCGDVAAWNAAQCAGDIHILPGLYTLKFERFGWVTVTEMLFDADKFDHQTLADPISYSTDLFVATFEWNDGDPRICSFFDGECVYRFTPTEIDVAVRYGALQNALADVGALWWNSEDTKTIINLLYGDRDLR